MDRFLLSPFSITVLNVCFLLIPLIWYLSRNPEKSAATRSVLVFLSGAALVFLSFIWIFSSVDAGRTTYAWWAVHSFIFPAVAMVQFAYQFPENPFPEEADTALKACLIPACLVYPFYVHHTLSLTPTFSFEGFLFAYLDTPEVGIVIGAEILWMLRVFYRKAMLFEEQTRGERPGPRAVLFPVDPRTRLIRNLMVIFFSPLILIVAIILAYAELLSWGLVGHILGSGLMLAAFFFAVIYINNCAEPSSFMLKLVGSALGSILIVFGLGGSIALGVSEEGYDRERALLVAQGLQALESGQGEVPGRIAYVIRWEQGRPRALMDSAGLQGELTTMTAPDRAGARGYRQLDPLDPERFYVTYTLERGADRVEVGFRYLDYRARLHATCLRLLGVQVATVVLVLTLFPIFFRLTLLRPMNALLEGVGAVNDGDLDARVPVQVRDEIGFLSSSFNRMVASIQQAERELQDSLDYQVKLTDAYSCFFPREFLEFLEKESVTEIRLGDNVQLEMTVLFSDIRSFTNISEKMSPEENFAFINEYLGRVGPIVRERGGFIDKYIGDAVMALFPSSPDDAVDAAVKMQEAVERYNEDLAGEDREAISIGIGLHTGSLMLGTIGEERRMEGTVISDAVNLASRLEGLTKVYGASILISEATRAGISDPSRFEIRPLDSVQVKGKQESVDVHEVLDGVDEELTRHKLETRDAFGEAVSAYRGGDFEKAQAGFEAVLDDDDGDVAARLYVERCRHFREHGTPEGWDGVTALTKK